MSVSEWTCMRACICLFVCLCAFVNVQSLCIRLCVRCLNACFECAFSLFVCVWRSVLRPVVGRPCSQMCLFLYFAACMCVHRTWGVCVCVHIPLLVYCAHIRRSACDLARWRGNWLVFMNKRHNCDRMMYDQRIPQPPLSFFSLFLFAKNIYL